MNNFFYFPLKGGGFKPIFLGKRTESQALPGKGRCCSLSLQQMAGLKFWRLRGKALLSAKLDSIQNLKSKCAYLGANDNCREVVVTVEFVA